jgi:hypothetical protein
VPVASTQADSSAESSSPVHKNGYGRCMGDIFCVRVARFYKARPSAKNPSRVSCRTCISFVIYGLLF